MPHIEIPIDELPLGRPRRVEYEGFGIVVVRQADSIVAFEDACPHAGWRLSEGDLADGRICCPGHGWEFELHGGRCADVPAYCLRPVRVLETGGNRVRLEWQDLGLLAGAEPGRLR